jgi:hypothetical protein
VILFEILFERILGEGSDFRFIQDWAHAKANKRRREAKRGRLPIQGCIKRDG